MDTQSTNETSVRVARNNNGSLTRQDTEVLIQPATCPLVCTGGIVTVYYCYVLGVNPPCIHSSYILWV